MRRPSTRSRAARPRARIRCSTIAGWSESAVDKCRRKGGGALSCLPQHHDRAKFSPTRPHPCKTKIAMRADGVEPSNMKLKARARRDDTALCRQDGRRDNKGGRPRAPLPDALKQLGRERVHRRQENGRLRRLLGCSEAPVGARELGLGPKVCHRSSPQVVFASGPKVYSK